MLITIYVAETNDLQEHQDEHHPAGSKLVNESHPVYPRLGQTHTHKHKDGGDVKLTHKIYFDFTVCM